MNGVKRWWSTRDSEGYGIVFLQIYLSHMFSLHHLERNSQYINRPGVMNTSNEYDFLISKLNHICEEISQILTILTDDKDEPLVLVPRRSFIRHLR